jgi:uncharacterized membrane-anchored protein YjiN (DUF445 family)
MRSSPPSKRSSGKRYTFAYAPAGGGANGLRDMKLFATGLLGFMAALFVIARLFEHIHPAMGFLKAFAEAGMIGGMADWFAVTALFRHPLGLPIPHTAIIPRNKDRIGDTLAQFLRSNFLTAPVVARRMQRINVASAIGHFLADPERSGAGRVRNGASRLIADLIASLDDQQLGGMVKGVIADRLRHLNAAPLIGQALVAAMKEGRHVPLQDGILSRASAILASNEQLVRDMVHERSGRLLRWTGLDEDVADAIINGLNKLFADMVDDPAHPLRQRVNEGFIELADRLQHDPEMQARVATIKHEIVENPAMQAWIASLWDQGRDALIKAARDPGQAMAGRLGDLARQLGETLASDPKLALIINRFARRAVVGATASYGDSIVKLVSETVRSWDTQKVTDRIENAVGRDLQYIRINGTMVGGLVGLVLHAVDVVM